ncbi:MAG: hypothetical protein QNK37_00920 [Acidobacteriota bacterium]|nr:hypothetical protein [Acidobacteriota bacterium]
MNKPSLFFTLALLAFAGLAQKEDEPDRRTRFDAAALEEGRRIGEAFRRALGAEKLMDVADYQTIVKVENKRGLAWNLETTYHLVSGRSVRVKRGSGEPKHSGFDGHWEWTDRPGKHGGMVQRGSDKEQIRFWLQELPVILVKTDYPMAEMTDETIDGKTHKVVRLLHPKDGSLLVDLWVDEDHFIRRARYWSRYRADRPQRAFVYDLSDYRPINGVLLPHRMESRSRLKTLRSLVFNPSLPKDFYRKPDAASYLPPYKNIPE